MTQIDGIYGMSFPFRINSQGGVTMSRADGLDVTHLEESIRHILMVRPSERVMLPEFYTDLDQYIFDRNDVSIQSLIKFEIMRALRQWETRITVRDVSFDQKRGSLMGFESSLFATIHYTVNAILTPNSYTYVIELGGIRQ